MSTQTKTLYGIIAVLVAIVIIVSTAAALFYYQYNQVKSQNEAYISQLDKLNATYYTDALIDYGNGTNSWHNNTQVKVGSNLWDVTRLITNDNVTATCCAYGEHFIEGIYGVEYNSTTSWFLWTYNSTALWQVAPTGPDDITVQNNTIFAWTFCGYNATTGNPDCTP